MDFKDQLKSQLNIVDVIGHYVRLKPHSPNGLKGLCPFHTEKTPSFHVRSDNQYYYCFGCNVHGDVFRFVMEHDQLTFPEAVRTLAERYGIPMPQRTRSDDPTVALRESLYEMHELAAEVFVQNLRGSAGAEARRYLEQRGVSESAVNEFRLGYSDPNGQQLATRFKKFGSAVLDESGLVSARQDGSGHYDRFRGRLMFPIHNESGKVIAFGGRALRAEDQAKYINSTETKIYRKSEVVYNLHRAKQDGRRNNRFVLVEGYMDVIAVYNAGVQEVVASCGTALTKEQVRILRKQVAVNQSTPGQVIVNFDGDAAGVEATQKRLELLLHEGMRIKVLGLPGGKDPDDFIKENGADRYRVQLEQAKKYQDWLADWARQEFDDKVDAFRFLAPYTDHIPDRVERAAFLTDIAESLRVPRELINEHFQRSASARAPQKQQVLLSASLPPNEKILLTCLLLNTEARMTVCHYLRQSPAIERFQLKVVFEEMLTLMDKETNFSLEDLFTRLEPRVQRMLAELSFAEAGIREEDAPRQALECLRRLETNVLEWEQATIRHKIKELEREGNLEQAFELMQQLKRAARS